MEKNRSLFSVEDKVIILTGGAGFLGREYANTLSDAGARVTIWDRDIKSLNATCEEALALDITDEAAVHRGVMRAMERYGRIDVLINNAALNPALGRDDAVMFAPIENYPLELWRREIDVNLTGMFICTKAVVSLMKQQGRGIIINIASQAAVIAHDHRVYNQPGKFKSPAYIASKTGVIGFTRACAAQLGQFGVRVIAFSPDTVKQADMPSDFVKRFGETNMLGRCAEVDEYSGIILFLCSDSSSFITGTNLIADGGKSAW